MVNGHSFDMEKFLQSLPDFRALPVPEIDGAEIDYADHELLSLYSFNLRLLTSPPHAYNLKHFRKHHISGEVPREKTSELVRGTNGIGVYLGVKPMFKVGRHKISPAILFEEELTLLPLYSRGLGTAKALAGYYLPKMFGKSFVVKPWK